MTVIIAGAGITGLTTALSLQKLDIPFHIYEKAPELRPAGAGIWMAPNAMKVFDWLGIAKEVKQAGVQLNRISLANKNLKPLRRTMNPAAISKKHGLVSIHRARLQELLYSKIPASQISLNNEYLHHQQNGGQVEVSFSNAQTTGSILLGADGIHSAVRSQLFPTAGLRYSGQTCWRGIAEIQLPDDLKNTCIESWGYQRRFGFSAISKDQVYWFAVKSAPADGSDDAIPLQEKLLQIYAEFAGPIPSIIKATPSERIIRNDLYELKRLGKWYKGTACLIGDAAHAMTPNMGQGGAQGVEDAYYISNILAGKQPVEQAFEAFEKQRRKKTDMVVKNSWMLGKMAHHPVLQPAAILAMKATPQKLLHRQILSVYAVPDQSHFQLNPENSTNR